MRAGAWIWAGLLMSVPLMGQDFGKVDEYLTAWANTGQYSGSVLIAKDGNVLLRKGYGMADRELNVPNSPEMIYRIGSISKTFTAFAILQLEERGKLKVEDPVVKYIPEMPEAWQKITIEHLLTHTSGLPNIMNAAAIHKTDDPLRIEKALQELGAEPLVSAPGEKFAYSNSGYVVLGRIIEKVSGMTCEQYLDANILRPARLQNTDYDHSAVILKNRVHGYVFRGDHMLNSSMGDMGEASSAGGMHSTPDDLYQFDQALNGDGLFTRTLLEKAWKPRVKYVAPPPFDTDGMYCYGWMSGEDYGHPYLNHGGWVEGFITQYWRYPQDKMTVILTSNVEGPYVINIQKGLVAALFGKPFQMPVAHKAVDLPRATLERYAGMYHTNLGFELAIFMEEGHLMAQGTNQPKFQMQAQSETEFFFAAVDTLVRFNVSPQGEVQSMTIHLNGKDSTAPKVK